MNTENNKLIADFLGYKVQTDPTERWFGQYFKPNYGWVSEKELDFYSDWNSLMLVVEKIELMNKETGFMGVFTLFGQGRTKVQCYVKENLVKEIDILGERYGIAPTYKAVVEFIKFYKQEKLR